MTETTIKLNQLLVLLTNQYYSLKHYHWNFSGNLFFQYHTLFDEFATKVFASQDEIAERIRQLQQPVDFVLASLPAQNLQAIFPKPSQNNLELILDFLIKNIQNTIDLLEEIIALASQNNDYSTADILTKYLEEQQKYQWFFRSSIAKPLEN